MSRDRLAMMNTVPLKASKSTEQAFTLLEIMIVVAIIGLLASIAMPNFVKARLNAQATACINNLRLIDAAKQQWGTETGQKTSATPTSAKLQPYLGRSTGGEWPSCPADGTYTIGNLATPPTCSLGDQSPPHALP